jgi:hypothetical protein
MSKGSPRADVLSQFVEAELFHTIGSYSTATELLDAVLAKDGKKLLGMPRAIDTMRALNVTLDLDRDRSSAEFRHPDAPPDPFEQGDRFEQFAPIYHLYAMQEVALGSLLPGDAPPGQPTSDLRQLATGLYWEQDPTSASESGDGDFRKWLRELDDPERTRGEPPAQVRRRVEIKRARYRLRKESLKKAFGLRVVDGDPQRMEELARQLLETDFTADRADTIFGPSFVLECLVAAHLRLHRVEHELSRPFAEAVAMDTVDRDKLTEMLDQAEALNTFVFVTCRGLPWIFAETEKARNGVIEHCMEKPALERQPRLKDLDPTWFARQVSLLALARRGFGFTLADRLLYAASNELAFKDYNKLQRLLRVTRRSLPAISDRRAGKKDKPAPDGESIRLISAHIFLDGLDSIAETHTGELYRSDHAHPIALSHFCDAADRLEQLSKNLQKRRKAEKRAGIEPAIAANSELDDSRWRVHLLMSKGKGFYEIGAMKRSLKWFIRSWETFLVLLERQDPNAADAVRQARERSRHDCSDAVEALKLIRNDPDFSRFYAEDLVRPIVEHLDEVAVTRELDVLGAEILLRLGHILTVLALSIEWHRLKADGELDESPFALAYECLTAAAKLDPSNALIDSDMLKIEYAQERGGDDTPRFPREPREVGNQWPLGRGDPERAIRMIEYLLLKWVDVEVGWDAAQDKRTGARVKDDQDANRSVARSLIIHFLAHTASINVRQSSVYQYLMRERRPKEEPNGALGDPPVIEFVCLRRYSSFFPFVPRPSAFRAIGGGYFVRLRHQQRGCPNPFGIVIDPGPDFIENFYRHGFSLSDIDMIVVTHDHADHMAALDPILSLLGYRMRFGGGDFKAPSKKVPAVDDAKRLLIVGNESVVQHLSHYNPPHVSAPPSGRRDAIRVVSFDDFQRLADEMATARQNNNYYEVSFPTDLQITPVVGLKHRDSRDCLSYGLRIALGTEGPSIGFTSDTGGFRLVPVDSSTHSDSDGAEEAEVGWEIKAEDPDGILDRVGSKAWERHWQPVLTADVLVAHLSAAPMTQLQALAGRADGSARAADDRNLDREREFDAARGQFLEAWRTMRSEVQEQVSFALWLTDAKKERVMPLTDPPRDFRWRGEHLYLAGVLEFARAYRQQRESLGTPGLFLVGELREELGTFRSKIADNLNRHIFEPGTQRGVAGQPVVPRALTADVGLRVLVERGSRDKPAIRILCSTCDLDNDRTPEERFHEPREIFEICVKGENEAMFYNCSNHDPFHHDEPAFLERIERYDVFANDLLR